MRSSSLRRCFLLLCAVLAGLLCLRPRAASAFCGFYVGGATADMFNNATQVVLMRQGTTTVLSMQNNYQGPPEHFALVVPVPVVVREDQVKTLPRELFAKVDQLGAPRLVEYWEQDPCDPYPRALWMESGNESMEVTSLEGATDSDEREYQVKIEAEFSVGEYDIVVLSAKDSTGLERWLLDHKYKIPAKAAPLLRPYVESGTKFFVAKVDPKKVRFQGGMATLSPLRFHYESLEFFLPIRLGLAASAGTQDLIISILGTQRYEVANFPNTVIPTNLVVKDSVRTRFAELYAAIFDETLRRTPGAVVTEYVWDSASCDPCPGPTLDASDLATLGADVIGELYREAEVSALTLTRLHARYGKDVSEDLVFRAVAPLAGGSGTPDPQGRLTQELFSDRGNAFQARYAILHPWTGELRCESPQRGVWGEPPSQQLVAGGGAQVATDLAFVPRGKLELAEHLTSELQTVGVLSSQQAAVRPLPRRPRACGCSSGAGGVSAVTLVLLALLLGRRRRR